MSKQRVLLQVEATTKSYDDKNVCKNVTFSLKKSEIGCLLGPSGCGKTTLLRMIAGFEQIEEGTITIDGKTVSSNSVHVPPEKRGIGMVFQDYALFPHLTVSENVGFGLAKTMRERRKTRVHDMLELVGLAHEGGRYPHERSGGQQQRVALARALAPEPDLLLLDEPFSNLDALLRDRLTVEVRDILKEAGITALVVTHNQHEAFSVADKIGILFEGRMQQWDSAYDIYHKPANLEVATFVGEGCLIKGRVVDTGKVESSLGLLVGNISQHSEPGSEVAVLVRPEDVLHVENSLVQAKIVHKSFRGPNILYQLLLDSGEHCYALVSSHHNHEFGESIGIVPEVDNLIVFNKEAASKSITWPTVIS